MSDSPTSTAGDPPPAGRADETQVYRGPFGAVEPPVTPPGRYDLKGEIARGGMGVIFAARDTHLGREVAVKALREEFRDRPAVARRFVEEAQITGQLQHPGAPPVHDLGVLPDGRPFIAMKLIKGRTLADRLGGAGRPPLPRLLEVFEKVCQTVAYAHSKHVIHRDLKPANVMVGAFGEVQVMDWGLAKVLTGGPAAPTPPDRPGTPRGSVIETDRPADSFTQAGSLLGTPAYMPPEQARGDVAGTGERADVFALGAILCELLTGEPPYTGTAEQVRGFAVAGHLAPALARLDGCGADPELVALAKRCLAAEAPCRPADAAEVAFALVEYRAGVEDRLRRAELDRAKAEVQVAEQRKRRRVQLALAGAVGLLVAGGGAVGWWQDRQATQRRVEADNRDRDERARLARSAATLADLAGRCEEALREGDADRAAVALDLLDRKLPDGGEAVRERVERGRADLAMLRELNAVDTFRWTLVGNKHPDRTEVAARWRVAFAGYRVVPDGAQAGEVAGRLSGSLIQGRLLAALDLWLVLRPSPGVRELLRAADPDVYRDAVRDAVAVGDRDRVAELAGRTEALAQPPGFAAALGQHPAVPTERRRVVLEAALRPRPGDLSLLMALGKSYPPNLWDGAGEPVRWFQAAVAAHPRSSAAHHNLGFVLGVKGNADGAAACYREAIRLDPENAYAHNQLAWLQASGPDGVRNGRRAVEHAKRACELTNWTDPVFIDTLAAAHAETGDFGKAVEYQKKALSVPGFEKAKGAAPRQRLDLYARKKPYHDPSLAAAKPREVAPPPRPAR